MYSSNTHFLDANILIASRINWESHYNRIFDYMENPLYQRHTSRRVYKEVTGVLERNRRLILKYIEKFYQTFMASTSNPLRIQVAINGFKDKFIKSERLNDKQERVILSFTESNLMDLQQIVLGGETYYGEFRQEVIDTFNSAINSFDSDCSTEHNAKIFCCDICPRDYAKYFPMESEKLTEIIAYENDVLVLLDSYYIKCNHIKNSVCFITEDRKHILKNKEPIESILIGIAIGEAMSETRA